MTTMANGAYVRLNIDGDEINAYLSADSGLFCPSSSNSSEALVDGTELKLEASIQDNCDRLICEKTAESIGIEDAAPYFSGGGKIEKIFVGKVVKNENDGELTLKSNNIVATFDPVEKKDFQVGDIIKVVGDLVFLPKKI